MKLALFTVSYCGLWYRGKPLTLIEQIKKAKEIGFDGITIETKRPVAFPPDLDNEKRKNVKELAHSLSIELDTIYPPIGII